MGRTRASLIARRSLPHQLSATSGLLSPLWNLATETILSCKLLPSSGQVLVFLSPHLVARYLQSHREAIVLTLVFGNRPMLQGPRASNSYPVVVAIHHLPAWRVLPRIPRPVPIHLALKTNPEEVMVQTP
jgi:hypothetical protein